MGRTCATVATGLLLLLLSAPTFSRSSVASASPHSPPERLCMMSSLKITLRANDGLSHGGEILIFQNRSSVACQNFGFALVRVPLGSGPLSNQNGAAKRSAPGSSVNAIDQMNSYAGGISGSVPNQRLTLPVVSLLAYSGSASATIVWNEEGASKACPWIRSIDLRWKVSGVRLQLSYPHLLCRGIDVTPIVPGSSGQLVESG